MADVNELVKAMKKAARDEREASKPAGVYFGEVRSVAPLRISVEQKMELGEAQLVLARGVTDHTVTVSVQWETEGHKVRHMHAGEEGQTDYAEVPHAHALKGKKKLMVHGALEVGDKVMLVRQQGGQKFVVVDRIGGEV